tara:strand:+ start:367 stop:708 length:342 start_codon:yes stop_codon:yes gene_type:complete
MPKKKVKKEVVEPAPEPEPEKDYVEYTTSKGVVKRKQKVEDPPFEWLECDLEDDELEELNEFAEMNPPLDIGVDFMLQLIARGSTIQTAKKKWREIHKDLKDEASFINEMKKH